MVVLAGLMVVGEIVLAADRLASVGPVWAWSLGLVGGLVAAALACCLWREWLGWHAVRRVDRLRSQLGQPGTDASAVLCRWAHALPEGQGGMEFWRAWQNARRSSEASAARKLDVYLERLDARVDSEIRREAARTGLLVTLSGVPWIDAAICVWRNLRLMRRVATAYGARPGAAGTVRLLRMVLWHAVAVDVTQHAADLVSTRIGTVASAGGQGLVAATLTARLGLWTQQVCRPLPMPRRSVAGFAAASAADEVGARVKRTVEWAARAVRARGGNAAASN